jgi:hypothetical protein
MSLPNLLGGQAAATRPNKQFEPLVGSSPSSDTLPAVRVAIL